MTNIAASSNFPRMTTMAKTDEVVSAKMIPVVQGIVDWIEAHIFDTLSVSAIAKSPATHTGTSSDNSPW